MENELNADTPILQAFEVERLLSEEDGDEECRVGMLGYPTTPLIKQIVQRITSWIAQR